MMMIFNTHQVGMSFGSAGRLAVMLPLIRDKPDTRNAESSRLILTD